MLPKVLFNFFFFKKGKSYLIIIIFFFRGIFALTILNSLENSSLFLWSLDTLCPLFCSNSTLSFPKKELNESWKVKTQRPMSTFHMDIVIDSYYLS